MGAKLKIHREGYCFVSYSPVGVHLGLLNPLCITTDKRHCTKQAFTECVKLCNTMCLSSEVLDSHLEGERFEFFRKSGLSNLFTDFQKIQSIIWYSS